jgi:5-methylcytosine-specific restriction endonuclease McrA
MKIATLKPSIGMLDTSRGLRSVNTLRARGSQRTQGKAGVEQRQRILLRDKYTCQCGCRRVGLPEDLHVDHIVPLFKGGSARDDSNLQTLFIECHKRKTAREQAEIHDGGACASWSRQRR